MIGSIGSTRQTTTQVNDDLAVRRTDGYRITCWHILLIAISYVVPGIPNKITSTATKSRRSAAKQTRYATVTLPMA